MTFVEKHRFGGQRSEQALLKMSWEGELFGAGRHPGEPSGDETGDRGKAGGDALIEAAVWPVFEPDLLAHRRQPQVLPRHRPPSISPSRTSRKGWPPSP
jgi:hypothetical protein